MTDFAVCILAGGQAVRLTNKLERDFGGTALIARVYENVRGSCPVYISAKSTFAPEVDALLDCPLIIDRWDRRGPLGGILSVFGEIEHERVFVLSGDTPFVDVGTLQRLRDAWQPGDEAVVAQPLVALYDRKAFLREGWDVFARSGGVRKVASRVRARSVDLPAQTLTNINTAEDLTRAVGGPHT